MVASRISNNMSERRKKTTKQRRASQVASSTASIHDPSEASTYAPSTTSYFPQSAASCYGGCGSCGGEASCGVDSSEILRSRPQNELGQAGQYGKNYEHEDDIQEIARQAIPANQSPIAQTWKSALLTPSGETQSCFGGEQRGSETLLYGVYADGTKKFMYKIPNDKGPDAMAAEELMRIKMRVSFPVHMQTLLA